MRVDIIIPTFNRSDKLEKAIISAQSQTYKNIRILVINNDSTDNTEQVVNKFRESDIRVEYRKNNINIGLTANVRKCFESVISDYFCILTDDDYITKNFISDALNAFKLHPDCGFVALDTVFVDESLNIISKYKTKRDFSLDYFDHKNSFYEMTRFTRPYSLISILFRGELANLYSTIDTNNDIGSDFRYLMHVAAKYNWSYLNKIGACVTVHSSSYSVKKRCVDWEHDAVQMSRYVEIIKENPECEQVMHICRDMIAKDFKSKSNYYFKSILRAMLLRLKSDQLTSDQEVELDLIEFSRLERGIRYWFLRQIFLNTRAQKLITIIISIRGKFIKYLQPFREYHSQVQPPELFDLRQAIKLSRDNTSDIA